MAKYLDLKVGKKLKVYKYKSGTSQNGNWAFFTYTPAEKDQNDNYVYGQEYTIVINNIDSFRYQLQEGMQVEIDSIISVTADFQSYTSKQTNQKINKTVIKVAVNLKVENMNQQQVQEQNPGFNNSNDFNGFGGGYDMPNF